MLLLAQIIFLDIFDEGLEITGSQTGLLGNGDFVGFAVEITGNIVFVDLLADIMQTEILTIEIYFLCWKIIFLQLGNFWRLLRFVFELLWLIFVHFGIM